jgi:hypothetical protein
VQREHLEAIGLVENEHVLRWKDLWDQKFDMLVAFKANFGHCNVPYYWQEDRKFGIWVAKQRSRIRCLALV